MELWEKRYLHERSLRDARCVSAGVKVPIDIKYGELTKPPRIIYTKYNGIVFWNHFESEGHTDCVFGRCICSKPNKEEDNDTKI